MLRVAVWRKARRGDLTNYLEAINDALQSAEVIENDSQFLVIHSVMGHDKLRPRVEIELVQMGADEAAALQTLPEMGVTLPEMGVSDGTEP